MPSRLATPACGPGGNRTLNLARKRRLLSQLSYEPVMDGVRIELTMLASERRGYGPLDHHWSHPVLVRRVLELPSRGVHHCYSRFHRTDKKSGRRESNPLLREGVPVPSQWARVHGRKESNLQRWVLEARALTGGASAVDGARAPHAARNR